MIIRQFVGFLFLFLKVHSVQLQREKRIWIQFLVEELTLRANEVNENCKIYFYSFLLFIFYFWGGDCFQLMHVYNVENRCVQFKQRMLNWPGFHRGCIFRFSLLLVWLCVHEEISWCFLVCVHERLMHAQEGRIPRLFCKACLLTRNSRSEWGIYS